MVRQRDEIYDENYLDKFYVVDLHKEIKIDQLEFKIWNLTQVPRFYPDKTGPSYGTDVYLGNEFIHSHIGNYMLILNDRKWLDGLIAASFRAKMKL